MPIIYGRRRVGKSHLILEAINDQPHVYYQASRMTDSLNQQNFKEAIKKKLSLPTPAMLDDITGWNNIFSILRNYVREEMDSHLTIVLDEFPYLCDENPGLPSILQGVWDEVDRNEEPINLILCGSKISFMEELLRGDNPLYGRQALNLDLQPMTYREVAEFFPNHSPVQILEYFGTFGGVPYYSSLCDPEQSWEQNLLDLVLRKDSVLKEEPEQLLQAELRKIQKYSSLLNAIGQGETEWSDILNVVQELSDGQLGHYLSKLEELHLIRWKASLEVKDPDKKRNRRYYLNDPFFQFWYRFVYPNMSLINENQGEEILKETIEPQFNQYMGDMFEKICHQYVQHYGKEVLNSPARETGKIWTGDFDIDVAGTLLNDDEFYGECKWWEDPVGDNVLDDLEGNIEQTDYATNSSRKHRLLFSKSGFTDELRDQEESDETLHLLLPEDLV